MNLTSIPPMRSCVQFADTCLPVAMIHSSEHRYAVAVECSKILKGSLDHHRDAIPSALHDQLLGAAVQRRNYEKGKSIALRRKSRLPLRSVGARRRGCIRDHDTFSMNVHFR